MKIEDIKIDDVIMKINSSMLLDVSAINGVTISCRYLDINGNTSTIDLEIHEISTVTSLGKYNVDLLTGLPVKCKGDNMNTRELIVGDRVQLPNCDYILTIESFDTNDSNIVNCIYRNEVGTVERTSLSLSSLNSHIRIGAFDIDLKMGVPVTKGGSMPPSEMDKMVESYIEKHSPKFDMKIPSTTEQLDENEKEATKIIAKHKFSASTRNQSEAKRILDSRFRKGDVVQFNETPRLMLVVDVLPNNRCYCKWIKSNGIVDAGIFKPSVIEKFE